MCFTGRKRQKWAMNAYSTRRPDRKTTHMIKHTIREVYHTDVCVQQSVERTRTLNENSSLRLHQLSSMLSRVRYCPSIHAGRVCGNLWGLLMVELGCVEGFLPAPSRRSMQEQQGQVFRLHQVLWRRMLRYRCIMFFLSSSLEEL